MSGSPLITFIVPTYNIEGWMLRECIGSILAQPLADDEREVIVVDDGSDEPVAPMDGVTLVRETNSGQACARNLALDMARGEWVAFVDADDRLLEGWGRVVNLLHDSLLDVIRIGVAGERKGVRCLSAADYLLGENMPGAAWRYVFRRRLLDGSSPALRFTPGIVHEGTKSPNCDAVSSLRFTPGIVHEDEEFMPLMLARAGEMAVVGGACYYYRVRGGSTMTTASREHIERRLRDFEGVVRRLHALQIPVLRRRVAQLVMDYVYNSMRLERSYAATRTRVRRLRDCGLWPLPPIRATWKYDLFRLVTRLLLP